MAEYDLKIALTKLQNRRMNFAFYRGVDADQILITAKPPTPKLIKEMEKECGESKRILKGVVFADGGELVFATKNAPSPMWENQLRVIFKDRKCTKFLPLVVRQLKDDESDEVELEEIEGGVPGAPPVPPTVPGAPPVAETPDQLKARWEQTKAAVVPQIKEAIGVNPALREQITPLFSAALGHEKNSAFAEALAALERLRPLLGGTPVSPTAPPPPPPPPGNEAAELTAALNKLVPLIKQAVADQPEFRTTLLPSVANFQTLLKANNFAEARAALGRIAELLRGVSGTVPPPPGTPPSPESSTTQVPPGAPTSPVTPSPTATETPGQTPAPPPSEPVASGAEALATWRTAKETADEGINRLRDALLKSGVPEQVKIADEGITGGGLNALTGGRMVALWSALLDGVNGALDDAKRAKILKASADLRAFLAGDRRIALADKNPFTGSLNLRGTLLPALDQVAKILA